MANPNIAVLASFTLESYANSIGSSVISTVVGNASGSGAVLEVFSAIFANIDGVASVDVTLDKVAADGAVVPIGYQVTVLPKRTEVLITNDWPVVLMEGECLRRQASVGGDAAYVVSLRKYS